MLITEKAGHKYVKSAKTIGDSMKKPKIAEKTGTKTGVVEISSSGIGRLGMDVSNGNYIGRMSDISMEVLNQIIHLLGGNPTELWKKTCEGDERIRYKLTGKITVEAELIHAPEGIGIRKPPDEEKEKN